MNSQLSLEDKQNTIQKILINACVEVCGSLDDNTFYAKPHIWRDAMYTGIVNGSPVVWKGWSTRLNPEYKTTYIDVVPNILDSAQKERLYGKELCSAIEQEAEFIIAFVTGFKKRHIQSISEAGFVIRHAGTNAIHACIIIQSDINALTDLEPITTMMVSLILLGKSLLLENMDNL